MNLSPLLTTLTVLGLTLGLAACTPPAEEGSKDVEVKPIAVEAVTLKAQPFTQYLEFPGTAQPVETMTVSAEASGRVLSAPFEEGQDIKKGASIVRVDAKMNRAQINVLKSQYSAAQREYNRTKQLAAEGLATPQQLDQARSGVDQLRASISQVNAGISMTSVRSPFSGYVRTKHVDKGEFVGAGQPVATIIDFDTIEIKLAVPETSIGYIKEDQPVQIRVPSLNKTFEGKVYKRAVMADQPAQTFPVEVRVENKDRLILPGMRAVAMLPKVNMAEAIVVPRDAILEGVNRREAMVATKLNKDVGQAQLRVVELGEGKGNQVVITSGLNAGDRLITVGHRGIVDGSPIRVIEPMVSKPPAAPAAQDAPKPAQAPKVPAKKEQ